MIGVALERSPDDCRQLLGRRRGDAQRLVDEFWAGRQQLLDPAQIVLAKGEEDLDRQRPAQQPDEELDQTPLRVTGPGLVEQGHDLLELIEDQQQPMPLACRADAFLEHVHGQHSPRRRFLVEREDGRQQLLLFPQSPANGSPRASLSAGDPSTGRGLRVMNSRSSLANTSMLLARSANGSDDMSRRLDDQAVGCTRNITLSHEAETAPTEHGKRTSPRDVRHCRIADVASSHISACRTNGAPP